MKIVLTLLLLLHFTSAFAQAQTASGQCADAVETFATEEMNWQSASVSLISQQELQSSGNAGSAVSEIYEVFGRRRMNLGHVGRMQGLEQHLYVQAMTSVSTADSDSSPCEMQVIQVNP